MSLQSTDGIKKLLEFGGPDVHNGLGMVRAMSPRNNPDVHFKKGFYTNKLAIVPRPREYSLHNLNAGESFSTRSKKRSEHPVEVVRVMYQDGKVVFCFLHSHIFFTSAFLLLLHEEDHHDLPPLPPGAVRLWCNRETFQFSLLRKPNRADFQEVYSLQILPFPGISTHSTLQFVTYNFNDRLNGIKSRMRKKSPPPRRDTAVYWDGNRLAYPHRTGFRPVSDRCQTSVRPVSCRMHSPCHSVSSPIHSPCHRVMSDAQSCSRICGVSSSDAQCHFGYALVLTAF